MCLRRKKKWKQTSLKFVAERSRKKERINYCYKRRKTRLNDSHEKEKMQLITQGNLSSYTADSKTTLEFFKLKEHETTLETLRLIKMWHAYEMTSFILPRHLKPHKFHSEFYLLKFENVFVIHMIINSLIDKNYDESLMRVKCVSIVTLIVMKNTPFTVCVKTIFSHFAPTWKGICGI